MAVMLSLSIMALALVTPVTAQDTIAGSRTISDTTVAPGDTFTVTVNVDITGTVYGPVLDEDVATGWTVTEADNAGGTPGLETSWLWGGAQTTDKTVIYEVTVPGDATEGAYPVTGTVLATAAGETIGPFTITGDESVTVSIGPSPTLAPGGGNGGATIIPTPTPGETPTPPAEVTPTPTPFVEETTPSPSPTPSPTPKPPGFEAVFAIAGLLAVAYLVLRRKK